MSFEDTQVRISKTTLRALPLDKSGWAKSPKTFVITTDSASNCPISVGISPETLISRPATIASSAESADVLAFVIRISIK